MLECRKLCIQIVLYLIFQQGNDKVQARSWMHFVHYIIFIYCQLSCPISHITKPFVSRSNYKYRNNWDDHNNHLRVYFFMFI